MRTDTRPAEHASLSVNRLVPFVHVADVEGSLAFYARLGFEPQSVAREPNGRAYWALARSGPAEIMLARASGPIDPGQQAVLFYMYSSNIAGLRQHLLASGLRDAGAYTGASRPDDGPLTVFEVAHQDYMPGGEMRVIDPDGYVILVGQLG